jgi:hypothetical protein
MHPPLPVNGVYSSVFINRTILRNVKKISVRIVTCAVKTTNTNFFLWWQKMTEIDKLMNICTYVEYR